MDHLRLTICVSLTVKFDKINHMTAKEARQGADEANVMRFEDVIDMIILSKNEGRYFVLVDYYDKEFCRRLIDMGYKVDHNESVILVSWLSA